MKKHSLKATLYGVFAGSVLMPFLVISLMLLFFFRYQILNSYQVNNRVVLETLTGHLDSSLESAERFFSQYLVDTDIARFYQYLDRNEIQASRENLYTYIRYSAKYRSALNRYLTIADENHRGIGFFPEHANRGEFFYLNKYGSSVLQYGREAEALYEQVEALAPGQLLFFPGSLLQGCEGYSGQEPVFTMLRPVNHLETASRQGYVFLELSSSLFERLYEQVTLPEGAGLVIYFPNGTPAYASLNKLVLNGEPYGGEEVLLGKKLRIEGRDYYLYHMREEQYGFSVDYLIPQSTILREANRTAFVILLFWSGALAAAFFLFMSLSRRISASTEKIMNYIRKYRLGDEENENQISGMSVEEFSDISLALTEMTGRISDLVQHEYIWKMKQQMAEYKAMQAEINPHFFYNVMNSLQALNRIGDTKMLERGILNFSRMFRYSCEPGYDSDLRRECAFIESYLMLEKLRFEERLSYELSVEEGLLDFSIPKLLLQPLIENAMRHGMTEDGRTLHILLQVCQVEGKNGEEFVWISIANDGRPYEEKEVYGGKRVGVSNVRERLLLTYPDSFFWYSRCGRFQTVCNLLIARGRAPLCLERSVENENLDCR